MIVDQKSHEQASGILSKYGDQGFSQAHLAKFISSLKEDLDPDKVNKKNLPGLFSGGFGGVIIPHDQTELLGDKPISRFEVVGLVKNAAAKTETVCAAILSWGNMRGSNRNHILAMQDDAWIKVCSKIRNGDIDRQQAYDEFKELKANGRLKGVGPAYFTKLIYFFMESEQAKAPAGWIMDQWAACSINLIFEEPVVRMDAALTWKVGPKSTDTESSAFTVADRNTIHDYENFCQNADLLQKALSEVLPQNCIQMDRAKLDRAFLSGDDETNGSWRKHLLEMRMARNIPTCTE